jgi:TIGR03009 family protein
MSPRRFAFALICLFLCAVVAPAQTQQQPTARAQTPPPADQSKLPEYLRRWEKEMASIQTLKITCNRTVKDPLTESVRNSTGVVLFMRPNLAAFKMAPKEKPNEFTERAIYTGNFLYYFDYASKVIQARPMTPPKSGQVADDTFLPFLTGMKADEAVRRYDLKIEKEDQWYAYVIVVPRLAGDRAEFTKGRLVFNKETFLPRQLWYVEPNSSQITFDLAKVEKDVRLDRKEFEKPEAPPGWKLVVQQRGEEAPPRIIRPQK